MYTLSCANLASFSSARSSKLLRRFTLLPGPGTLAPTVFANLSLGTWSIEWHRKRGYRIKIEWQVHRVELRRATFPLSAIAKMPSPDKSEQLWKKTTMHISLWCWSIYIYIHAFMLSKNKTIQASSPNAPLSLKTECRRCPPPELRPLLGLALWAPPFPLSTSPIPAGAGQVWYFCCCLMHWSRLKREGGKRYENKLNDNTKLSYPLRHLRGKTQKNKQWLRRKPWEWRIHNNTIHYAYLTFSFVARVHVRNGVVVDVRLLLAQFRPRVVVVAGGAGARLLQISGRTEVLDPLLRIGGGGS